jgi:hypothetical protein
MGSVVIKLYSSSRTSPFLPSPRTDSVKTRSIYTD